MAQFFLALTILIYGLFVSPTPDHISWVIYAMGGMMLWAVLWTKPLTPFITPSQSLPLTLSYHRLFFVIMMTLPLMVGAIGGYPPLDIMRDIIPIAFLFLPLCFYGHPLQALPAIMAVAGGLFALRYLAPLFPELGWFHSDQELLYLANAPLVSFAAIYGFHWMTDPRRGLITKRLLGAVICALCFAAMAVMMQRAPMALCAIACLMLFAVRMVQNPFQSLIIAGGVFLLFLPILPFAQDVFHGFAHKTLTVGWNSRLDEFHAVLAQATWMGTGWGGIWASPAVGDIHVRFTHNIVSYYWLKAGAVGAVLSTLFIALWGWQAIRLIRHNTALGLAIFVPFVIHTLLYTGFKTLDFALLLTVLNRLWSIEITGQSVKSASASTSAFSSSTGFFRRHWGQRGALPVT